MTQPGKKNTKSWLLRGSGFVFLMLAAQALYLGFLSPLNRGKSGMAGASVAIALLFGVPGAFLLYRASKAADATNPDGSDDK